MGCTTKKIAEVSFVTDTDSRHYEIGEVNGAFDEAELKKFIKSYGHEELCAQLGYMQFQIWQTLREVNQEKDLEENNTKASY